MASRRLVHARWVDVLLFPDNRPSADHILPEYQGLQVGDKIPDGAPETGCFFVVEELRARELMVLHSWTHLPAAFRESGRGSIDWTWTFALSEVSEGRTRFHFRVRGRLRPWWLEALYHLTLVPADFIMSRSLCRGLKRRAEGLARRGAGGRPQP